MAGAHYQSAASGPVSASDGREGIAADSPLLILAFLLFLSITPSQTRPSDDGKGTYREMTLGGNVIVENIYLNQAALEVTFVKTDGLGEVHATPRLSPRPIACSSCCSSHTC